MVRNVLSAFLIWSLLFSMNCYGKFNLVREVYSINNRFNLGEPEGKVNKAGKSIFMILLGILPIYLGAAIIDVVFLNLVEFWTDKNPLSTTQNDEPLSGKLSDGTTIETYKKDDKMYIHIRKDSLSKNFIAFKNKKNVLFESKDGVLSEVPFSQFQFNSIHFISAYEKPHLLTEDGDILF